MTNEAKDLILTIPEDNIPTVFSSGGIEPILKKIKEEITPLIFDVSTAQGRKDIASMAYKVARTKTYIDKVGKEYVDDIKKQAGVIDKERKKAKDTLTALQDEIRKPLTEWEEAEKKRKDDILAKIEEIRILGVTHETSEQAKNSLNVAIDFNFDESFGEYEGYAKSTKDETIDFLTKEVERLVKYEAEQAELERLRQEAAEREQRERDEEIAREAAEKARREAEEKAEQERLAAVKREQEAREAAEKAEADRIAALERAEREKKEAIEAERQRAQAEADRIERERIEKERLAKEEAERLAADKEHRKKINNAALQGFAEVGFSEDDGKKIIEAIAKGEIPFITINYRGQ